MAALLVMPAAPSVLESSRVVPVDAPVSASVVPVAAPDEYNVAVEVAAEVTMPATLSTPTLAVMEPLMNAEVPVTVAVLLTPCTVSMPAVAVIDPPTGATEGSTVGGGETDGAEVGYSVVGVGANDGGAGDGDRVVIAPELSSSPLPVWMSDTLRSPAMDRASATTVRINVAKRRLDNGRPNSVIADFW